MAKGVGAKFRPKGMGVEEGLRPCGESDKALWTVLQPIWECCGYQSGSHFLQCEVRVPLSLEAGFMFLSFPRNVTSTTIEMGVVVGDLNIEIYAGLRTRVQKCLDHSRIDNLYSHTN